MASRERRVGQFAPWLLLIAGVSVEAGCAEFAGLNPYYRQQWAEDDRILPSFHVHLAGIRKLESEAARMPPAEQRRTADELTRLIQEDKHVVLRTAAVRSLGAFPLELAKRGILLAAADPDARLRAEACTSLRKLGDAESIGLLVALVENDSELDVRIAATRALSGAQDPRAFQALGLALDDTDPALQYRAMQSLGESSGRAYGNNVALWKAWMRGENPEEPRTELADTVRSWLR